MNFLCHINVIHIFIYYFIFFILWGKSSVASNGRCRRRCFKRRRSFVASTALDTFVCSCIYTFVSECVCIFFLDTFVYMYLSVPLHHSYLIVSTFWLSHKVSMRSIFCSLFFKRFFYYCILFRHRQRKFNGNSCRKNAAKNAQQDTQNSPAKPHFDSVFLSISNIFSNETGSLRIRVGFLF